MKPGVLTSKFYVIAIALALLLAIGLVFDFSLEFPLQKLSYMTALLFCIAVLMFIFIRKWPFVFFEKRKRPAKVAVMDNSPKGSIPEDEAESELSKKIRTGVFNEITNGFVALDPGGQIIYINKKAAAIFSQSADNLTAKNIWAIPPFNPADPLHTACIEAIQLSQSISREFYYSAIDTWFEANIHPSPDGPSIFLNDITQQKKADEKIGRARRLYYFISHINQMIVRAPHETALFHDACNIAIAAGQFKMAWIGMSGEKGNPLVLMATAGQETPGLIENLVDEQSRKWLLVKEDLGQPGYLRCNNIEHDPTIQASLKNILQPQFGSFITIPIKRAGEITGSFNLYADSTDFFDQEEIDLLLEAGGDISFTLDVLDKDALRKKAEKAVLESERRYQTLAEVNPVGIFHTDALGYTTYVNPRWCQIAGWPCEKAMGNGWLEAVYPSDREALEKGWNRATRERDISLSEYRFIHADGNVVWVIGQANPEYDADNRIIGYVGTITDITSRKKAEEEIKKANDRFELIARATNDAVFELDFQTGESWYNKAFRQLFNDNIGTGNIREDVTQWISRLHPDDVEKITKKMETAYLEPSALFAEEFRFKKANGRYGIFYDRSFISRDQDGKAIRVIGSMTDITDLKTVEDQLLASEEKYRTLFYNNPMPCWVTYKESADILDVNDAALSHYGYTRQEFLAMKTSALLPPGVYEQYRIIKGSGAIPAAGNIGVWPQLKKDGTAIEVELKVHDIVYNNKPCRITLANDVTEQRKAEAEIKKANERFELIAQATNDIIWDWDLHINELWWNDKYHSLFGYPKEPVNQPINSWKNRIHPNDADRVLRGIHRSIDSGKSHWQDEYRYLKNDDTIVYIFDRGFILRDSHGAAYRMMGSMLDMTELKRAQDSVVNEKNLSDSIINSLPGIFYLFDKNGKYLRWNKNFETVTMYSPAEIRRLHPTDLFEQDEKGLITSKINNTFAAGEENVQATLVSKTNVKTPYYFTGIFIDYEGSPCLMGVGIDFSERVKAQEKVEQTSQQLRQLAVHLQTIREEERKRIGREIHDELGQQLTAIKMDIAWIDKKIPEETITLKNKLKNVIELLDDSNRSIRRILTELRSGILEDHGLLEAVQWLGRQFTNNTGIPIHFTSSESEIVTTSPVANCIFRACQEAYTNITRYANASSVTTSLQVMDGAIVVMIEDNGIGFDKTSVQDKKSFGILGMKERVVALGGSFHLRSSPGQGTTITLRLPADITTNH